MNTLLMKARLIGCAVIIILVSLICVTAAKQKREEPRKEVTTLTTVSETVTRKERETTTTTEISSTTTTTEEETTEEEEEIYYYYEEEEETEEETTCENLTVASLPDQGQAKADATVESVVVSGKYPTAAYVWNTLSAAGWSDYVCAGVIGNMMAECGGQTLALDCYADSGSYYGLCQWSKYYFPAINGAGLEAQCDYLLSTAKGQFGSAYGSFLSSTSAEEAAVLFAQYYERCGGGTYYTRQVNAAEAYSYFVG